MAIGPRRPLFYIGVLSLGFVLGDFISAILKELLPPGKPTDLFTYTVEPSIGPFHIDLLILSLTVGPLMLEVSLLGLIGIVLAYMLARSLF
ncbi:MAG: DUF4321 domain-containing protein [Gemmatimonadota bacterium]|nr:MAG: DUF4321 domain-containing protein [Gemmatimonadota bacterium]